MSSTRTLVLVGKVGSGKSATGNSILGEKKFKTSILGPTAVTTTCQMESTTLSNGRTVNVIDTPGMFARSVGAEKIIEERDICRSLAKGRIHAVILVFSISSRFSEEEDTTLDWLQQFFGKKIVDYMILVFTGVDLLKKNETFSENYQSRLPQPIKDIIKKCKNRVVPFDNTTKDDSKKNNQLKQLLLFVDTIREDEGKSYSEIPRDNKFETKLEKLNKDLTKEQNARKKAEEEIIDLKKQAKKKTAELDKANVELNNANVKLNNAKDQISRLQKTPNRPCCAIL